MLHGAVLVCVCCDTHRGVQRKRSGNETTTAASHSESTRIVSVCLSLMGSELKYQMLNYNIFILPPPPPPPPRCQLLSKMGGGTCAMIQRRSILCDKVVTPYLSASLSLVQSITAASRWNGIMCKLIN